MKKNLKIFVKGYVLFLVLSVLSCHNCGDDSVHTDYSVTDFHWELNSLTYDNGYLVNDIIDNTISYDNYAIFIRPELVEVAISHPKNNSLITSSYACSPLIGIEIIDEFTEFHISCNTDYNTTFLQGENSINLFDIVYTDFSEFRRKKDFSEFLNDVKTVPQDMYLVLKEAPTAIGNYQFTITMEIQGDNLNSFELQTEIVEITL